jgi:hypothetical protein
MLYPSEDWARASPCIKEEVKRFFTLDKIEGTNNQIEHQEKYFVSRRRTHDFHNFVRAMFPMTPARTYFPTPFWPQMRAPTEDNRGMNEETAKIASAIMLLDVEAWLYEHFDYHLLHMAIQATRFRRSLNLDRF